jgi:hypothetical protein
MSKDNEENSKIQLKGVRLSFPSIFQKEVFEGKEGKYAATFLIPKDDVKTKKKLDHMIAAKLAKAAAAGIKIKKSNVCLKDGDESEYGGYEDHWSLKASNKKRPTVIDRNKEPLTEEDEKLYAGCYVNAIIDFWIQDNKFGKKLNANLYGIQFAEDGEPLGAGPVDVTDEFDSSEEDEDDDL